MDLMVPFAVAGRNRPSQRSVVIDPHDKNAARNTIGIEGALVDFDIHEIRAEQDDDDHRIHDLRVAGPAALLVAKWTKLGERATDDDNNRFQTKDAHDAYRLLKTFETHELVTRFEKLLIDQRSMSVTRSAIEHARTLFSSPDARGARAAGEHEGMLGNPTQVAASVAFLTEDLLQELAPMLEHEN